MVTAHHGYEPVPVLDGVQKVSLGGPEQVQGEAHVPPVRELERVPRISAAHPVQYKVKHMQSMMNYVQINEEPA